MHMAVTVQLPADIERRLRTEISDLDAQAKEAVLLELYRQDKLSHHELSQSLGLDRFETDALLKRHGVTEDLPSSEELKNDLQRLREMTEQ
jgi:predicted HTH domain antitoxin